VLRALPEQHVAIDAQGGKHTPHRRNCPFSPQPVHHSFAAMLALYLKYLYKMLHPAPDPKVLAFAIASKSRTERYLRISKQSAVFRILWLLVFAIILIAALVLLSKVGYTRFMVRTDGVILTAPDTQPLDGIDTGPPLGEIKEVVSQCEQTGN
jgi:hypothetical protein